MADPKHQKLAPLVARDRTRDVEMLAARLFVALYPEGYRTKLAPGIARDAIAAARDFYRAIDTDQQPAKE